MNENSNTDNSTDENTVSFEWATHKLHNQLHCLFQIAYNQLLSGSILTPLTASFGQYQNGKNPSREV